MLVYFQKLESLNHTFQSWTSVTSPNISSINIVRNVDEESLMTWIKGVNTLLEESIPKIGTVILTSFYSPSSDFESSSLASLILAQIERLYNEYIISLNTYLKVIYPETKLQELTNHCLLWKSIEELFNSCTFKNK